MTQHLRILTAVALVATALLSLLWTLLEPPLPAEGLLTALADGGTSVAASGLLFAFAQLLFAVGMVGLGCWLRSASPRLAATGASFGVLGAFGHTLWAGVMLVQIVMAADAANHDVHAALVADLEASLLFLPFSMLGLAGTVLGVLLLSIALWRSRRAPRWAAPALWAFLLVEFVGTSLSDWATYVSGVLYLAAFAALAARIATERADVPTPAPTA
ncbi:hypothetical protein GCM10023169_37040 [Georgenia halophila]|uniref:DUF4386 family protein n=1 Tax=Georgenia halophila TaxID=620889 RepID=A0ABP8LNU0_9MICO